MLQEGEEKEPRAPVVRFSEFLGMGYFGDERQDVVAPIFDSRRNAEKGWSRVMEMHGETPPAFHAAFVEHPAKYEFIAYPLSMNPAQINYVIYRSFSSLASLRKFKETHDGRTFIKFGWQDITKPQKFDVLAQYALVDAVEFLTVQDVKPGTMVDRIRKNEL
ncbi:hypothetical protein [Nitrososphaera viennensis]|uniref:hypothetical protein n=1 Tax=Nitrososphaera viennensis TaxID=1034015 RepID=UPI0021B08BED|nr:hypothetical protein [Nitrososphaera viennensis]